MTNSAVTEWTQHRGHSYVKSPCLGFGFNSAGEEGVVYLDDLAVWSFSTKIDDGAEPAHMSQVKKTVSFKNSTGKNVFGYFFESRDGNYTIYLDNFYYWYVPTDSDDADKNVTITFANSTTGLRPGTVTMPEPITKKLWENESTGENTIDLNSIVPTSYTIGYRFVGWSRTDGGKVISTKCNGYLKVKSCFTPSFLLNHTNFPFSPHPI